MDMDAFLGQVMVDAADLVQRVERALGRRLRVEGELLNALRSLAYALDDPESRQYAAITLMGALYPEVDPPLEFWRTEAGLAVARAIGYHRIKVPNSQAAAILNVSRQRIHQLCEGGQLTRYLDGVLALSLREHLAVYGRRR